MCSGEATSISIFEMIHSTCKVGLYIYNLYEIIQLLMIAENRELMIRLLIFDSNHFLVDSGEPFFFKNNLFCVSTVSSTETRLRPFAAFPRKFPFIEC